MGNCSIFCYALICPLYSFYFVRKRYIFWYKLNNNIVKRFLSSSDTNSMRPFNISLVILHLLVYLFVIFVYHNFKKINRLMVDLSLVALLQESPFLCANICSDYY